MKKLIVLLMLFFSFSLMAQPLIMEELATNEQTIDNVNTSDNLTSINTVDGYAQVSIDSVTGYNQNNYRPMQINAYSCIAKRDNSNPYKKIVVLNFRDGPQDLISGLSTIICYSIPRTTDTGTRVLRRSPFSGFKRHNIAS